MYLVLYLVRTRVFQEQIAILPGLFVNDSLQVLADDTVELVLRTPATWRSASIHQTFDLLYSQLLVLMRGRN